MNHSPKLLRAFRDNGAKISEILQLLAAHAQKTDSIEEIELQAQKLIAKAGGSPAFMRVPGYRWATCVSINDAIVHGIPEGKLKEGDVITIDTGMFYKGTTTDTATSFVVGTATRSQQHFLDVGRKSLDNAISQVRAGNKIRQISAAMQQVVEKAGFSVSRNLTGHGLGKTMHEEPAIPCFSSNDKHQDIRLQAGQVLAVEIMYMKGDWPLMTDADGWTMRTSDSSLSAVFEHDVIVTHGAPEVITA